MEAAAGCSQRALVGLGCLGLLLSARIAPNPGRSLGLQIAKKMATTPSMGAKGPCMRDRLMDLLVISLLYIPM